MPELHNDFILLDLEVKWFHLRLPKLNLNIKRIGQSNLRADQQSFGEYADMKLDT